MAWLKTNAALLPIGVRLLENGSGLVPFFKESDPLEGVAGIKNGVLIRMMH
jgi:hypothetical protein